LKAIFLDVDGVLNHGYLHEKIGSIVGIGDEYVERLQRIVTATGAKIVLTSSWKTYKDCDPKWDYLIEKLKKYGLEIYDVTKDRGDNRGYGILKWYTKHGVTDWVVLDDEEFDDYMPYGILSHLVKTSYYTPDGGLQDEDVDKAIEILNRSSDGKTDKRRKRKDEPANK